MSDVEIPFGENNRDTAVLLLAAADDLGLDRSVVRTKNGAFVVPEEVNEQAFGKPEPAKKAPAKKAATKKTAAKKAPAKKK